MKSYEYIEKVKEIKQLDTDYKVAKMMGWHQHKISNYKDGQSMDNEAARQVAEILDVPLMKVIADMESQRFERQGKTEKAKAWSKLSKMAGNITSNLLFLLPFWSILLLYIVYYVK
jgi:predicted transcriptional regulator